MICLEYSPSDAGGNNNDNIGDSDKTTVIQDPKTLQKELDKAKGQSACLIIIRGSPQGHRFFLTQETLIMGREVGIDITISDPSISRRHAKFTIENDKVFITDLGSANGTLVNHKKIPKETPTLLGKEDFITLGNSILKFLPAGEYEALAWENLGSAANTDALTNIYNKRYLIEALEAEFKRAKTLQKDFSILFFDLDKFKNLNDNYGHDAGDFVLREFANLVKSLSQNSSRDIFARYGGEEFVLLLWDTNAKVAEKVAEKIRSAIETHAFIYNGKRLPVTTSLGVAELTTQIESSQTLLKKADEALYKAKNSGRNCVVVHS